MADLSTADRNALSDSDFAYIDSKGGRHLPINDAAHVRAALGGDGWSATQFETDAAKKAAANRIRAAAKRFGVKVADASLQMAEHTHAKKGGGRMSHDHEDADPGHAHDGMLPLPGKEGFSDGTSLIRLEMPLGSCNLAEKRVPFLRPTSAHFDDYGDFTVTRSDLDTVRDLFYANARRQDIPMELGGETFGEVNEDHHFNDDERFAKGAAIGWIRGLEFSSDDPDLLEAIVETTPYGDRALTEGAYAYTSPEVLRNWTDPETGATYPIVATGLAVTNKPRLKSLGRIAASEEGAPSAAVLAFSEGPIKASIADTRRQLLAEMDTADTNDPDGDGDDDGPVPPCVWQPPFGSCPGYTRRPGDTDGDGTCLFSDKGCNGYRAIDASSLHPLPTLFTEGGSMPPETQVEAPAPSQATETPATPAAAPAAANMSEADHVLAAERAHRERLERQVAELSETVARQHAAQRLVAVTDRLDKAQREGRITPAQRETYGEKAVMLSEESMEWLLEEIESREPVIKMSEIGSGAADANVDESAKLDIAARTLMSEAAKRGEKVTYKAALLTVSAPGFRG